MSDGISLGDTVEVLRVTKWMQDQFGMALGDHYEVVQRYVVDTPDGGKLVIYCLDNHCYVTDEHVAKAIPVVEKAEESPELANSLCENEPTDYAVRNWRMQAVLAAVDLAKQVPHVFDTTDDVVVFADDLAGFILYGALPA